MSKFFLSAAAASLALFAVPAVAESADSVVVSYADLDLGDPADVAVLDQRLVEAATKVCGRPLASSVIDGAAIEDCKTDTLRTARMQAEALLAPVPGEPLAFLD